MDRIVWSNRSLNLELPKIDSNKARYLKKKGVQFLNGTDFEENCPDWEHQLWTLQTSVLKDVPSAIPFSNIPFEEWRQFIELHFNNRQNSLFAVLKGKLIGSLLLGKQKDGIINIEHNGVDKNYRRMGVSTVLKVKAFALAKTDGANTISTQNHQRNPMLALNFRMGFRSVETLIEMKAKI